MHWIWYLPDKKQELVQIHNLMQEFSEKKIYVIYAIQVRQSLHRNRVNYLFIELNKIKKEGDDFHYHVLVLNEFSA